MSTSDKAVEALLEAAGDSNDEVRSTVLTALLQHAGRESTGKAVLIRCKNFLSSRKSSSTTNAQRTVILTAMSHVVRSVEGVDDLTLSEVVQCASGEMTQGSDINSEWAKAASQLCVDLCERAPRLCTLYLVDSIGSALPHFFTIQTLADFATSSPLRFLPYLKEAQSKLVPLLGVVKQDTVRCAFANAFGNFSDAILQLNNRNSDLTPRSADSASLNKHSFSDVNYSVLQVLLNDWSNARELKVRVSVFCTLGYLAATITDENLTAVAPKLIPAIIAAIKREKVRDVEPIVRGLAAFLSVCEETSSVVTPHFEALFGVVHSSMTATISDKELMSVPALMKNQHALCECAEHLTAINPDTFLTLVSKALNAKTGVKDPLGRAAVLHFLRHVVSRKNLETRMELFKDAIIATLKLALSDTDWTVRRTCVQVITGMGACKDTAYLASVGGTDLVTYILQCASINPHVINEWNDKFSKNASPSFASPQEVCDMANATLTLFTSSATQKHLDSVLWPFIFEHFNDHTTRPDYLLTFQTVCRCISKLAQRVAKTDRYYIDFSVQVNSPKPAELVAKLMVMASKKSTASAALNAMEAIAAILDDPFVYADENGNCPTPIATLWLSTIPELSNAMGSASQSDWEEFMLKFMSKTSGARVEEEWVASISAALVAQFPAYAGDALLSRMCLTMIGLTVAKCARRDFVASQTDSMIELAKHSDAEHRQGVARGFGYIAAQYTDLVIEKLSPMTKGSEKKGMFAKKDAKQVEEISRALAAWAYCHIAKKMPASILSSRLDAAVIPSLTVIIETSKLPEVRNAVLEAVPLLQAPILKVGDINYRGRDAFIETLITAISFDNPKANTASVLTFASCGVQAIVSLIESGATPKIEEKVVDRLVKLVLAFITKTWAGVEEADITKTMQEASVMLCSLMAHVDWRSVGGFLEHIGPYVRSKLDHERQRAILVYLSLIKSTQKRVEDVLREGDGNVSGVSLVTGEVIATLIPRLCDVVDGVKKNASEAIVSTFRLHLMVNSGVVDMSLADVAIKEVRAIRKRSDSLLGDPDKDKVEKETSVIMKNLCVQVVNVLPATTHFMPLLKHILKESIRDPNEEGAYAACVVMHGAVRGLCSNLTDEEQRSMLDMMIEVVGDLSNPAPTSAPAKGAVAAPVISASREQTINGLLLSVRNLTKHNPKNAFEHMLKYPVPHADNVVKALQTISGDTGLVTMLINHCMDVVLNSQLFEERANPKDKKKINTAMTPVPLSAASALGWICDVGKGADVARPLRGAIVPALLLYLSAAHHVKDNVSTICNSVSLVLKALASETTLKRLAPVMMAAFEDPSSYLDASADVIQYLCREELYPDGEVDERDVEHSDLGTVRLPPTPPTQFAHDVLSFVLGYVSKPFAYYRISATRIVAQLLLQCVNEKKVLHSIVNALLGRCGQDEQADIKVIAMKGLQGISAHNLKYTEHYVSPIIGTLLNSFGDANEVVALAAMNSLLHIMEKVPCRGPLSGVAVNITSRVKSMFEYKSVDIRVTCLDIYTTMLRLANTDGLEPIAMEQFSVTSLAAVLVHMEDEEVIVRQASKKAFEQLITYIGQNIAATRKGAETEALLESLRHVQLTTKTKWDEFSTEFARVWVRDYFAHVSDLLVNLTTFFASDWPSMRGAAALMVGFLLHHIPVEERGRVNAEQATFALAQHVSASKEKNVMVRTRTARALGLL
eukprot:PhM_4_TR2466/c0_g1_i1/m.15333